jgi:RNA polymerase sigma factor (TIGR02999 family)
MSEITRILTAIDAGDEKAARDLLPLVYDELRRLAAQKLAHEKPGHTLQATALVHEAYVRLVGDAPEAPWDGRGHFFAAAAEAMRRILVDKARRRQSLKQGGALKRVDASPDDIAVPEPTEPLELLAIHEALDDLAARAPR